MAICNSMKALGLVIGLSACAHAAAQDVPKPEDLTPTYGDLEKRQAQAIMKKALDVLGATSNTSYGSATGTRESASAPDTLPNVVAIEGKRERLVARILYASGAVDNHVVGGGELQNGLHVVSVTTSGVLVRRGHNEQGFLLPWSGSAPLGPAPVPMQQSYGPGIAGPGMAPGSIPPPSLGN